jgi:hypothetical protein
MTLALSFAPRSVDIIMHSMCQQYQTKDQPLTGSLSAPAFQE